MSLCYMVIMDPSKTICFFVCFLCCLRTSNVFMIEFLSWFNDMIFFTFRTQYFSSVVLFARVSLPLEPDTFSQPIFFIFLLQTNLSQYIF